MATLPSRTVKHQCFLNQLSHHSEADAARACSCRGDGCALPVLSWKIMADGGGTSPGAKAAALGGAQEERGAALPVVSSDAIAASNTELGEEATAMMRRSCWEFIAEVCGLLDMEHDAVEAATQFCHRFYLVQRYAARRRC